MDRPLCTFPSKNQWRGHPIQKLDHTNVSVLGIVQRYEAMFQENWKLPW